MLPDEEGFLYPVVDSAKCVDCGLCDKVCPVIPGKVRTAEVIGYIVRHRDNLVLRDSTSGGVFTALATEILRADGLVYGAGYDDAMRVVCKRVTSIDGLAELRGSKFVQSDLGQIFSEIKEELKAEKQILFSGTPCQVEGLLSFLGEKPKKLVCVDFVCRGVPSPGLWQNYVHMMEDKYGAKMVGAKFKNKTYGYHATTMKVSFANGKTYFGSGRVDPMMKAFVSELASRPSCAACAFKTVSRRSDITMFDCYNFSNITGMRDDNKGYSSVFVHSQCGKELFEKISEQMIVHSADVEQLVKENGIMVRNSAKANPKRAEFYRLAQMMPLDAAMQKISPVTYKDRCVEAAKKVAYKLGLVQKIKRLRNVATK